MPKITHLEAVMRAIREEMQENPRVFVMGTDMTSGLHGDFHIDKVGRDRVRNTPLSEAAIIGAAVGAAMTGMKPVVTIGAGSFLFCAMDQIANQAPKIRYMFGGQTSVPMIVRMTANYTASSAAHHADRLWGLFAQIAGLQIIIPTTPYDAKGLMKSAIRGNNPVLWFDDQTIQGRRGEVPDEDYTVPIGVADVKREGTDITVVAVAGAVAHALAAASELEKDDISVEVVDIRTIVPMDRETILKSVRKTGRLLIVDPAPDMCGVSAEVAAFVAEHAFPSLKSAIRRYTAPNVPVPFSPALEELLYPTTEGVVLAARAVCGRN